MRIAHHMSILRPGAASIILVAYFALRRFFQKYSVRHLGRQTQASERDRARALTISHAIGAPAYRPLASTQNLDLVFLISIENRFKISLDIVLRPVVLSCHEIC
jgi:hypothetical protein